MPELFVDPGFAGFVLLVLALTHIAAFRLGMEWTHAAWQAAVKKQRDIRGRTQ